MIKLEGVRKSFDGQSVLRGIELDMPAGKTTVVLGRSGCGKSVLLKVILRLMQMDAGKIEIGGVDTSNFSEQEMMPIRRKVGMLFQGAALFDSLKVWQNIAYPLTEAHKLSMKEIDERVMELLEFVELPDAADKLPGELSGGMKKRVALARALVAHPEYIFYDEPTTGLDPITASRINELIRRTQKRYGTTSVVVTHDMVSAFIIGDVFAFMNKGIIEFTGNRETLLNPGVPELTKFMGDAAPKDVLRQFLKIE